MERRLLIIVILYKGTSYESVHHIHNRPCVSSALSSELIVEEGTQGNQKLDMYSERKWTWMSVPWNIPEINGTVYSTVQGLCREEKDRLSLYKDDIN